jgi:hypothetical protein
MELFDVEVIETLYATYRVEAESAEEAESIVRLNARDGLDPIEEEPGNLQPGAEVTPVPSTQHKEGS